MRALLERIATALEALAEVQAQRLILLQRDQARMDELVKLQRSAVQHFTHNDELEQCPCPQCAAERQANAS